MNKALLIKQVRNVLGLKQDEFCKIFRIRADEISKWERNVRKVPDARVFQLKYYVEKNIGKKRTDLLFKEVIMDIDLGINESFSISDKSRIKGAKLMQELCNEKSIN